jgi:hypothetical protein
MVQCGSPFNNSVLNAKGTNKVSEIHRELVSVYGQNMMSKKQLCFCCNESENGMWTLVINQEVADCQQANRWQQCTHWAICFDRQACKNLNNCAGGWFAQADCVCMRSSTSSLDFKKCVHAGSQNSWQSCLHFCNKGDEFLNRTMKGDETWVHHDTPERKRDSVTWNHPGSPAAKKFKTTLSVRKVMASVLWDRWSILLIDFII